MLWITCPGCGRRPVEEYSFGGELRGVPDRITDPAERDVDYAWTVSYTHLTLPTNREV